MRKLFVILLCAASVGLSVGVNAANHSYVWSEVFPNYKKQIPSSDFTTPDGLFRFTSERADGATGPAFDADNNAGLLLRLYADNTLRIESLNGNEITDITFVIGGNGHYKLAELTPSKGAMQEPYLGKDATDKFREYRLFWKGQSQDITFTVGHECLYGIECAENGKTGESGTCMTKEIIITTTDTETAIDAVLSDVKPTAVKLYRNGKLFILRNGKMYTTNGVMVK